MGLRKQGFRLRRSTGRLGTRDEAAVKGRPDLMRLEMVNTEVVFSSIAHLGLNN